MTYRSKITGKYMGMGRLLSGGKLQRPCIVAGERFAEIARSRSPVGRPGQDDHAGLYRASFVVDVHVKNVPFRGKPRLRTGARVMNTAPHAGIVEYGNSKTPRYSVFHTTVDVMKARAALNG
ncbi:hypothetical protein [Streptomyces sp. NPDC091212]|uniref:hypothetical protein n=1 Tax=Streptomyces sp. NPDC091212 TaxID=3155191 RepID=UPI00342E3AC6